MNEILRFLKHYEILFFILLGGIILVYVRKVFLAWREWTVALFGLEKELSQRKVNSGLTVVLISVLFAIGLFAVNTFVTPSVPGVFVLATPTVDLTNMPTEIPVTPTPEITTVGLIPTVSAFLDKGCVPGQVEWSYPLDGDGISGSVILQGTVNIVNLGFYYVEFSPANEDKWQSIFAGRTKVVDGPLGGYWNTGDLTPGDYKIRLLVNTNNQEALPECKINVLIKAVE